MKQMKMDFTATASLSSKSLLGWVSLRTVPKAFPHSKRYYSRYFYLQWLHHTPWWRKRSFS
jgi:hypothetical protein